MSARSRLRLLQIVYAAFLVVLTVELSVEGGTRRLRDVWPFLILAALFPFAVVPALRVLQILLILVFCGDHRMKRAMRESDRLLAWTQAAEHFEQGSGTMITNWRYPTGLFRIWWTPDDLISAAPTSLPKSWDEAMDSTDERLSTFAETLFKRYLQEQDGTAKMVRKPLLSGVIAPEKPLSVQFPRARILSLVEFGPQY